MKLSIITVVYNNKNYIEDTIMSVVNQSYEDIEYIVIDGGSTDGTVEIIEKNKKHITKWISEPDNGIYNAMNKGESLAKGEVIGFLNSDDLFFSNEIAEKVMNRFKEKDPDAVYGDLIYISKNLKRTVRTWVSGDYREGDFGKGWMPPHPSFFVKKVLFEKYGGFREDFKIVGDYELMFRFIHLFKIKLNYLPETLIKMRVGGVSNRGLKNQLIKIGEIYKSWSINNLKPPRLLPFIKPVAKISQYGIMLKKILKKN